MVLCCELNNTCAGWQPLLDAELDQDVAQQSGQSAGAPQLPMADGLGGHASQQAPGHAEGAATGPAAQGTHAPRVVLEQALGADVDMQQVRNSAETLAWHLQCCLRIFTVA